MFNLVEHEKVDNIDANLTVTSIKISSYVTLV